jgi:TldD protein
VTRPAAIDPTFLTLPFERLSDAALARAKERGASYADFRFERLRVQTIVARDRELESSIETESISFSVRLICKGAWGFAAGVDLTTDAAAAVASRAIDVAEALARLNTEPVVLAEEPAYTDTYISKYELDPFTVPDEEKTSFLLGLNERALASGKIDRVTSYVFLVSEQKFLASLSGSRILQQRIRVKGDLTAVRIDKTTGGFETMGSATPPAGRGWEYFSAGCDMTRDADEIPALLEQKMASPSIEPGRYDLVIAPTNLWLTIHESIGHSTELDRVLGYEANYAGTSFATLDKLNTLQFGSPIMHVTGDRQVKWGLSTVGYDDEGVAAQTWDIVNHGVLVGYQLDRQMAHKQGFGRSNGCAFADAGDKVPIQRMPNVSLQPSPKMDCTSWATRAGRSTCSATTFSSPARSSSAFGAGRLSGR